MTDKSGSPPCGIYIQIDAKDLKENSLTHLRQMAMTINRASGYEKNSTIITFIFDPFILEQKEKTEALVKVAQADGLIALIRNDYKAAQSMEADGVILDNINDMREARDLLGGDAIIGVACGSSKETAEAAIANEADCVEFGSAFAPAPTDLIAWWSTKSQTPAIARGNLTNDNCGTYARAGAAFVDTGTYIFGEQRGVMQGTVNVLHALELVVEGRGVN